MEVLNKEKIAFVVFGEHFPRKLLAARKFDVIIASEKFRNEVEVLGSIFVNLGNFVNAGSIYEANDLLKEISFVKFPNSGQRISKFFIYKGYELWWLHYEDIFLYFCLPYTQYKKMLEHLTGFKCVYFYHPPYKSLFSCYLRAHDIPMKTLEERRIKSPAILPFGVFVQIILTLVNIPILIGKRNRVLLFIGDKFEKGKDYDFRMRFVYEEIRRKNIPFVEFVRGLETWKTVLKHAFTRRRPVIYSEAVAFFGVFLSIFSGGRNRAKRIFGNSFSQEKNTDTRFKLLVATQYLFTVYDDVWSIRIMKWILRLIGTKVAFIPAATKRNFHTVLGCKLNNIPTVGILHGVASRFYNVYDFLPGFDGAKSISVDKYGLWSKWWKEYYLKHSDAYRSEQLFVSGPMRPLEKNKETNTISSQQKKLPRVLFVAEQTAVPSEVMPYLNQLLSQKDICLTIKFRPCRDGFEEWLLLNEPDVLRNAHLQVVKGGMQEAIQNADVVVGCHSTGVLEALLQLKAPIFLRSKKWGDYYGMSESDKTKVFFVENPDELLQRIKETHDIPREILLEMQEQYFGDPQKNGSKWVVDKMAELLERKEA